MKKKNRNLLIMLLLCGLCFGAYGISMAMQRDKDTEDAGTTEEETVLLWEDGGDISRIAFTQGETEEIDFSCTDGDWTYNGGEGFALNTSLVETLVSSLQSVAYTQSIPEENVDAEAFGLSEPEVQIQFVQGDATHTLAIGDYNSAAEGYYVQREDDNRVYIVEASLIEALDYQLYDFLVLDEVPAVESDYVNGIEISYEGNTYAYTCKVEEVDESETETVDAESETETADMESETDAESSQQIVWYLSENGGEALKCDSDTVASLVSEILSLSADGAADYHVDSEEELSSAYGIGADYVKISYVDSETEEDKSYIIFIGNNTGDGYYYFTVGDSMQVQLAGEDAVADIWMNLS